MLSLKNWNLTLLCKISLIILIIISMIWTSINLLVFHKSKFRGNETKITGKIITYSFSLDNLKITLQADEKIVVFYHINNEKEKESLLSNINFGDILEVSGNISKPKTNQLPNTFSYQKYLYYHHINYIFNAKDYKIKKQNNILYKLKNILYKRMEAISNNEYLRALLLGDTTSVDIEEFQSNGISHLFAISGLHMGFIIAIVLKIFKKVPHKNILLCFILWFYAFLVNFSPSILRVVIVYTITFIVKKLKIKLSNMEILSFSFFLLLLINPFNLYDVGFQYTFLIAYSLAILDLNKIKLNLFQKSLFIFLVTIPITAINNYEINLLAIILNLIFIPFFTLIIFPLGFITFVIPSFNSCFQFFLNIFVNLNKFFLNISFGKLVIFKCSFVVWLVYGFLLWLIFVKKKNKLFLGIIGMGICLTFYPKLDKAFYYTVLNVGQGDSSLIITPHQKEVILIDTGGNFSEQKNYQAKNIATYIKSLGIFKIDYLILTHGDYDHMGNASFLLSKIKIMNVIFNRDEYNELEKSLIEKLNKRNISYIKDIDKLRVGNISFTFLNTKLYDNENDNSNVIYFKYFKYKFLLMGDAGTSREKDILKKYKIQDIDFYKVGHHGSKTSTDKDFIDVIRPSYSFISVGENNLYGHPKDEVLKILKNSHIYRTDIDGTINVKIDNMGYSISLL